MLDYSLFAAVAAWIRVVDPFTEYEDFTVEIASLDDNWSHILSTCAEVKADVHVREQDLVVSVTRDLSSPVYQIRYRSVRGRDKDASEFRKRYHQHDPFLVDGILKLFTDDSATHLYAHTNSGREYFGIRAGDTRVYEGCIKL